MAFCVKCGNKMDDDARVCPACGANAGGNQGANDDVQKNKVMAVFAYLGILVLVPIFAAKDSEFAKYHANQGLVLLALEFAYGIVNSILSTIILMISWRLHFIVSLMSLLGFVFLALAIIGIINVVNGQMKELPVIGKIQILK